jgi:uncharacterized protein YndB with AHSA1/START domain
MRKLQIIAEPGRQEVTTVCEFDAPTERVFKVCTDPALIPKWWGPSAYTTTVDKMEPHTGGSWRFVQKDADGNEFAFRGVYHSIDADNLQTVSTFEFEGMPGHVLMETVTYEEYDGKTTMRSTSVFQTVADRDGMMQTGMEDGAQESMDRLTALL